MVIGLGIAGLLLIPYAQDYGETMGEMYYRPLPEPSGIVHTPPTPPTTTTTPTSPTATSADSGETIYEAHTWAVACEGGGTVPGMCP